MLRYRAHELMDVTFQKYPSGFITYGDLINFIDKIVNYIEYLWKDEQKIFKIFDFIMRPISSIVKYYESKYDNINSRISELQLYLDIMQFLYEYKIRHRLHFSFMIFVHWSSKDILCNKILPFLQCVGYVNTTIYMEESRGYQSGIDVYCTIDNIHDYFKCNTKLTRYLNKDIQNMLIKYLEN